jgi:uncharacterized membrane-anchored protein
MELFFAALLSGLATAFVIGMLEALLEGVISTRWVRMLLTTPLSALGIYLLIPVSGQGLAVGALSSSFIALAAIMLTRRPEVQVVSGRRY